MILFIEGESMKGVSLLDAIGNLAVCRMSREEKMRILKEASKCKTLKEEIEYIIGHLPEAKQVR